MEKPHKRCLLGLGGLLLIMAAVFMLRSSDEQTYEGKTLGTWCKLLVHGWGTGNPRGSPEAKAVLQHFGNQVVPYLAKALIRQPDWRDKVLPNAWLWLPQMVRNRVAPPLTSMQIQENAREVVRLLEAETKKTLARQVVPALLARARDPTSPARDYILAGAIRDLEPEPDMIVPDLNWFLKDSDARVRQSAAFMLMEYGKASLPALTNVIDAVNDPSFEVRQCAIRALMTMGAGAKAGAPVLERCLADPKLRLDAAFALWTTDRRTNIALAILPEALYDGTGNAAYFLAQVGPAGREAIPALLKATEQKENNGRFNACDAIWKIDATQAAQVVRVLVEMLGDSQTGEFHLEHGARLLGEIGPGAKSATPVLTDLLKHSNTNVSQTAEKALRQINSVQ
jgi:HEAT repeat protein